MKCPEVSEEVKHGIPRDTRRSAGHPSDDFLGYPDDALYRNIIRRYNDNACFMTLSKQQNNKIKYIILIYLLVMRTKDYHASVKLLEHFNSKSPE